MMCIGCKGRLMVNSEFSSYLDNTKHNNHSGLGMDVLFFLTKNGDTSQDQGLTRSPLYEKK